MIDFRKLIQTEEYDFLRTNPRLGNRIMLLGLGGSYAYGTNHENCEIPEEYERRLDEADAATRLPDNPDMKQVEAYVESVNRYVVTGERL